MNSSTRVPLTTIDLPGYQPVKTGKVRSIYDLGDQYLFVASDRISAFDCILPNGIPQKGELLTQLSAWWFNRLQPVVDNHMITADWSQFPSELAPHADLLGGRSMLVKKASVFPIECVARGFIIGSGWKEYCADETICGLRLRSGYQLADQLDEPIFTPAGKAESGHDENICFEEVANRVGTEVAARLRDLTLALYTQAAAYAAERGILIADTKFEFGLINDQIVLVDEALTPDSSRYWPADTYVPGQSPPSFDKQFVRDYLEGLDWDKTPPAPALPDAVTAGTRQRYLDVYRRLTGQDLSSP